MARVDATLAIFPRDPDALASRAEARTVSARQERDMAGAEAAVVEFRVVLALIPSKVTAHERLGWTYEILSTLDPARAHEHEAAAVAHLKRAIAMAPGNAYLHRALVAFAAARPATLLGGQGLGRRPVSRARESGRARLQGPRLGGRWRT